MTSAQAQEAGVSRPSFTYLAKHGRIERACRDVYRVGQVPYTEYDAKHLALLWADPDSAALCYETALDAYGVCDVNPTKVHVVVGKGKRISRSGGEAYVVHREDLAPKDLSWWEGVRVVKLPVALRQCIDEGLPTYLAEQAIERARERAALARPGECDEEEAGEPEMAGDGIAGELEALKPKGKEPRSRSVLDSWIAYAATDPHDPPEHVNNRPRDVVDLLLLKELCESAGSPSLLEIRSPGWFIEGRVPEEHLAGESTSSKIRNALITKAL